MIDHMHILFHVLMITPCTFRTLHTALVRPHLDYSCVVWEAVQRRATSLIPDLANLTYTDDIVKLFDSLEEYDKRSLVFYSPRQGQLCGRFGRSKRIGHIIISVEKMKRFLLCMLA